MWLSTRRSFRAGDKGWAEYLRFIGLPDLREVRTLDSSLNAYVDDGEPLVVGSADELEKARALLPRPRDAADYYLLAVDTAHEQVPTTPLGLSLLGYDLSDETHTSSLLNCGPWEGVLAPLTRRLNEYGLLTLEDAKEARRLLPIAWPNEEHAKVTIWALYSMAADQAGS